MTYAEIGVATNFSFLRGASHPQEYVHQASLLGLAAIGVADRNTLAGVVRAYSELSNEELTYKPKLLVGARLVFLDSDAELLAYPTDRAAYGRLCRLLTLGKMRAEKGACHLRFADLAPFCEGLLLALVAPYRFRTREIAETLAALKRLDAAGLWLALAHHHRGDDRRRFARLKGIAAAADVRTIATNDVLYHDPGRRALQDVLVCVREKTTLDRAGRLLEASAERHLKTPEEMARLYRREPEALAETLRFAERIVFTLDELKYHYPDEPVPRGKTAQQHLEDLTWQGVGDYFPDGIDDRLQATLRKELRLIARRNYAHYFLTVHDIVRYARSQGILCQGRGSAANSAVCFVLGITCVNPTEIDLLFERFVSEERNEPPDIDVDFEHSRREEVMQYIYRRYGRHRAGIVATVIHYRPRSAIRDVGKALGLTEDVTAALADTVWGSWGSGLNAMQVRQAGLDPDNATIRRAVDLAAELIGFPRHLSQHVGGYVLTQDRLDSYVPIGPAAMEGRTFIEWDKDDIDAINMMKVDVLALGMLTCIRKGLDLIARHKGERLELADIRSEDDNDVYAMLQRGESIGVFQVESRAQMNMLPRMKPRTFYDLVIEVAIVRPGPIQGDMVHPYLRRRNGREPVVFPAPKGRDADENELKAILGKTLGVPLFQEQAMRIAIEAAKFTPDEANQLRRAMATFRNVGTIAKFESKMVGNLVARGYPEAFAQACFNQIKGFGTYGFPESHAASFAKLVYVSAWMKCRHPDAFCCALLNSQPMGFYAPAQIVSDARKNGVEVRAVDVSFSAAQCTLEERTGAWHAVRLGFRQIDGFRWTDEDDARQKRMVSEMEGCSGAWAIPDLNVVQLKAAQSPPAQTAFSALVGERWRSGYGKPRMVSVNGVLDAGALPPPFLTGEGNSATAEAEAEAFTPWAAQEAFPNPAESDDMVADCADWAARIVAARQQRPFTTLEDFARRTRLPKRALILLADADAFRSLGLDRRAALWQVRRLPDDEPLPLFAAADARELADEAAAPLPAMPLAEHVVADYQTVRLSLKGHPMQFLRALFAQERVICCDAVSATKTSGRRVRCAGVVLVRQRPGSAKGVIFMTIEDETGIANIVVWPAVMERFRKEVMGARLVLVEGKIQASPEGVVHLVAERLVDRSAEMARLSDALTRRDAAPPAGARQEPLNGDRRDHPDQPAQRLKHPRDMRILPNSRDFR